MKNSLARACGAEFLGTWILVALGCASVAQAKLGGESFGSFLTINLAWGMAVALAISVTGSVSGAHLNPAVTLALAAYRGFEWKRVGPYITAQVLGAFVGAATVYLTYREALTAFDSGTRFSTGVLATAGVFATYPSAHLSTFPGGMIDQTVATAILMMVVLGLSDPRNEKLARLAPVLMGALVTVIGMSFGFNAGYPINPARDFGPRLFTFFAGWGPEVFTAGNHWWWVPILGPCLGALAGAALYDLFLATERRPAT